MCSLLSKALWFEYNSHFNPPSLPLTLPLPPLHSPFPPLTPFSSPSLPLPPSLSFSLSLSESGSPDSLNVEVLEHSSSERKSGRLQLSDEEKRMLAEEGIILPTDMVLTKVTKTQESVNFLCENIPYLFPNNGYFDTAVF